MKYILFSLSVIPLNLIAQTEEIIIDSLLQLNSIPAEQIDLMMDPGPSMPEYPGGYDSLTYYFNTHNQWTSTEQVEGYVYIIYIIETDGSMTNIKVLKGLSPSCDQEAIRLAENRPKKWKPGEHRGKPVRMKRILPIPFSNSK